MSNERFGDEILSAIIDDEADSDVIASVHADSEAATRLDHMRQAVDAVASPPAQATAERRSASIAAAMAAASPAPEIASLAAARHEKVAKTKRSLSGGWIAAIAAAVAFVIAIPIAIGLGGNDAADTAGEAVDTASDSTSFAEAAETSEEAMEEEAMEESPADTAMEEGDAMEEGADFDESSNALDPDPANNDSARTIDELFNQRNLPAANNADTIRDLINLGTVAPLYTAAELASAGVSPTCLEQNSSVTQERPYALVKLTPFGGQDRIIVVEFADDETTRLLDAEDCAPLR